MKYCKDKDGNICQLQKCPFCGTEAAKLWTQSERDETPTDPERYSVVCDIFSGGCGASCGWHGTIEKAISRWNTRVVI